MKKHPPTLPSNHHTLRVAMLDVDQTASVIAPATTEAMVRSIERSFKKQLLKPTSDETAVEISVSGLRCVRLAIKRFGATALVIGVLRGNEKLVDCLTVCRAGLDNEEDEAAMQAAAALFVDGCNDPAIAAHAERLIETVREHPRPLAVHIHLDDSSFADTASRIVTHCLAECFFDLFGMEKSFEVTDV